MRFFIDAEFIEDGHTIDLISIGIVAEDGREFYILNRDCDWGRASDWVKSNVLAQLPPKPAPDLPDVKCDGPWLSHREIGKAVEYFVKERDLAAYPRYSASSDGTAIFHDSRPDVPPEFWSEWGAYDWVAFAQLFGPMMDLPKGFPMRVNDVIQWAETHLGLSVDDLPPSLEVDGNHNALLGAKTVQSRWKFCSEYEAIHGRQCK